MGGQNNIVRRNGTYYVRVRVPDALRARIGKGEIWKSLRTTDPEAAKRLKLVVVQEIFNSFDEARSKRIPEAAELEAIARRYYLTSLELDAASRRNPTGIPRKQFHKLVLPDFEEALRDQAGGSDFPLTEGTAELLLIESGFPLIEGSSEVRELSQLLSRVEIELIERAKERDAGDFTGRPKDPLLLGTLHDPASAFSTSRSPIGDAKLPLSQLLARMHAEKTAIAEKTREEHRVVVSTFEDYLGHKKAIGALDRADMIGFKQALLKLPTNRSKRFGSSTVAQSIQRNSALEKPHPTLNAKTINGKYLGHLKAILNWAVAEGIIPTNPADKVRVDPGAHVVKGRYPFTELDLRAIFGSPMFAVGAPRTTRFWVILVAAFSGLRSAEIAQLEPENVVERDGVWCFHITQWSHATGSASKRLKTGGSSERYVPIHPELISLGLLKLAQTRRAAKSERLFPDWMPDAKGEYSQGIPRWFNRTFLKSVEVARGKLTFHSWRHTFKDAARTAGIGREIHDHLTGHAAEGVSGGYGTSAAISRLKAAITVIKLPGVDLSHLHDVPASAQ